MLLSHSHKFMFIHIPKTAGSSITTALVPYIIMPNEGPSKYSYGGPHDGYQRKPLLIDKYKNYYKFAVVRNPFDRLMGGWFFNKKYFPHKNIRYGSFSNFIVRRSRNWQQHRWICRKNKVDVDFVARFENIDADFKKICDDVGIKEDIEFPHINKNPDKPDTHYTEFFDDHTRMLVEKHHATDLGLFGYSYDA